MNHQPKDSSGEGVTEGHHQAIKGDRLEVVRGMLEQAEHYLRSAKSLLLHATLEDKAEHLPAPVDIERPTGNGAETRVLEGVFDGIAMIGSDSRRYPVPPNYASKSKLVAGDVLKLAIAPDGAFIYKQIGPIDRKKLLGTLEAERGRWFVATEGKRYQVLGASVTFYRAKPGDQLTIVVPREGETEWAAVENLL